jgi:hypothetical protein
MTKHEFRREKRKKTNADARALKKETVITYRECNTTRRVSGERRTRS